MHQIPQTTGDSSKRILFQPSHREIANRAYAIFQARDRRDGDDLRDWLTAEREILEERELFAAEDDRLELDR